MVVIFKFQSDKGELIVLGQHRPSPAMVKSHIFDILPTWRQVRSGDAIVIGLSGLYQDGLKLYIVDLVAIIDYHVRTTTTIHTIS